MSYLTGMDGGIEVHGIELVRGSARRSGCRQRESRDEPMVLVSYRFAQFRAVCRRSKMVAIGTRSARSGSRLCRRWAPKWREEGQLLGQYLRATKCDKLSVSVCPTRAYASPCYSPSPPTGRAQPRSGDRARPRWPRASPTMSGRCERCCSFASRRGHSQQGCEPAAMVGSGQGRLPERVSWVRTAGVEGVTREERATGMP